MEKLKMHSPDLTDENIAKIRELFPGCVSEAKDEEGQLRYVVDFDQLRQELSDHIVEGPQERYQLNWPGKRESLLLANAPIAKTFRPQRAQSVNFDTTENLFIEGDNLEALKLLQQSYLGKVKLIYIDPPYNSGRDFVYSDSFVSDSAEFMRRSNQKDENGNRLVSNTESNGRFHSDWISMMYPRLKLARNLLRDDGVIFINIDDTEQSNLKKICDEIFGESNFICDSIWRSKDNSNNDAKRFSLDHNHTLIYSKNVEWQPEKLSDEEKRSHFKNPDNDPKGAYFDGNPLNSPNYRENLVYDLISPSGVVIPPPKNGWRWSKEVMHQKIESGEIRFTDDEHGIRRRTYLADMEGLPPSTLWIDLEKTGHNRQAKYELLKLLPEDVFQTPKPVKLIRYIIKLAGLCEGDVVVDFFAGAATTAHAVLQENAETGNSARFVMVQAPELTDEKSNAYGAGFKTGEQIGQERIRRAGKAILSAESHKNWSKDVGFRLLKIDTSNMADVYYAPSEVSQENLLGAVDSIKPGRDDPEDLLFQVLVDWGVDLTLPIRKEKIQGKTVFFVNDEPFDLIACFDTEITEGLVKELAKFAPMRVVFRDNGFVSDAVKINVDQVFRQLSPATEVKSI